MQTLINIASLVDRLIPFIIALWVLALIPEIIVWIIIKLSKENTAIISKVIKYTAVIGFLCIILWGLLNILARSFI
jgi:hypothetical protein